MQKQATFNPIQKLARKIFDKRFLHLFVFISDIFCHFLSLLLHALPGSHAL